MAVTGDRVSLERSDTAEDTVLERYNSDWKTASIGIGSEILFCVARTVHAVV
jgi:hypothetical protein